MNGQKKADRLLSEAATYSQRAADAELQGRPVAAIGLRRKARNAQAEARAMTRCGWTTWKPHLSPLADGTRKVVWQSGSRDRIYDNVALVFRGIKARMVEAR